MLGLQARMVVDRRYAVTRRVIGRAWLSAAIALFLVAVLPACWFGAKTAIALAAASPGATNNGNSDEEREDHRHAACITVAARVRPAQPARPPVVARPALSTALAPRARAPWPPALAPGTPHWLACARLSVRRLI